MQIFSLSLWERAGVRVYFTADDFGLTDSVNEAVERAHVEGVLTHASLMVAGPAAADAILRAKRLPDLHVGLHVVAVAGPGVLRDWFPSDQFRLGLRYSFNHAARAQLRQEIAAQFDAFVATGLRLSHVDAHKHMHMHPFVADLVIEQARRHGVSRIRVPHEPGSPFAMRAWSRVLRGKLRRAGIASPDHVFGLVDSGRMDEATVLRILARLPPGDIELYFHPATGRDEVELPALLSPAVRRALAATSAAPA